MLPASCSVSVPLNFSEAENSATAASDSPSSESASGGQILMLARLDPAAGQPHPVTAHRGALEQEAPQAVGFSHAASFFFSRSLSSAGLALPPVAFMVWPTKKPKSLSLPER